MIMSARGVILCAVSAALLAGCSTPDEPVEIHDPFEAQNRKVHAFNKGVDKALLDPAATTYGVVLPPFFRQRFANFAENLDTPRYFANDVLQANGADAVHNGMRFVVNTLFGVGGLFDVATEAGIERRSTGFGETLHVWGTPEGAYVELPVFGPSNQRDAVGTVVDLVSNPLRFALPETEAWVFTAAAITEGLNTRYELDGTFDTIFNSEDSYAQARSIYLQNRRFELGDEQDDFFFDPYEDFDFE